MKEDHIPVVFHIEMSNEQMSKAIAEATGAKNELLNAVHNVSDEEFKKGVTYIDLMNHNVKVLKEAAQLMSLLTCRHLSVSYDGKAVLSDLNFSVDEGDYLGIVGENGAGKSTLVKALLRLKKISGGEIVTADGFKPTEIGYLPQQTPVQKDFPASVWEVVLSGRLNRCGMYPFYRKSDKEDAEEKMEMLGIAGLKKRCYRDLSGGQQQRVLLARALCATGKLLLLDEPVTGLDPIMTGELYHIFKDCIEKYGVTVIMVSHDIRGTLGQANRILHLSGGTQQFFGTTEEYLRSPVGQRFAGGGL